MAAQSQWVDRESQRVRHELFDAARQDELVNALLTPAPGIPTSSSAAAAEAEEPNEEPGEDEEDPGSTIPQPLASEPIISLALDEWTNYAPEPVPALAGRTLCDDAVRRLADALASSERLKVMEIHAGLRVDMTS